MLKSSFGESEKRDIIEKSFTTFPSVKFKYKALKTNSSFLV